MRNFKNILVALREDDIAHDTVALNQAINLADANGARLSIITIFKELPDVIKVFLSENYDIKTKEVVIEKTTEMIIEKVAKINKKVSENLGVEVAFGTPFLAIVKRVLREKHDMVIIGGTEQRSLKKRIFGSTTMQLMRNCPAAVWVMNPPPSDRSEAKILACVDDKHGQPVAEEINHKVLSMATSIARDSKSKLHILQGWRHFGEEIQRGHWGLEGNQVDKIDKELHDKSEAALNKCVNQHKFEGIDHEVQLLKGDAGRLISNFVKENNIHLVVMGTVTRTGVSGFLIGNTAEKILRSIQCSVLTIKPDNWVSPVTIDD